MNFKNFFNSAKHLPVNVSVLLRGDHGIGKSQSVYQLAQHFGLDVIERRLSQMSEGDMIGLPKVEDGVTRFLPPDWYMEACQKPVLLFLDEINRATPETQQAAFQVVLDRELNGHKLHDGTRIFAAVNINGSYQVNQMDPALLDRFWVADLEPTAEDFFKWAEGKIQPVTIDFLKQNESRLDPANVDPGKKEPSRRTWEKLDHAMKAAKLYEADLKKDSAAEDAVYNIAVGFVGIDVARDYKNYMKSLERQLCAEDVLDHWAKNAKRIKGESQENWNFLIEKVTGYMKEQVITPAQSKNVEKFVALLPNELRLHFWADLTNETTDTIIENIKVLDEKVIKYIVEGGLARLDEEEKNK